MWICLINILLQGDLDEQRSAPLPSLPRLPLLPSFPLSPHFSPWAIFPPTTFPSNPNKMLFNECSLGNFPPPNFSTTPGGF